MTDSGKESDEFIAAVIRDVAELPDRSSPPDWPDAMLVTADELRTIIESRLERRGLEAITDMTDDDVCCEGCSKKIVAGDKYTTTLDGCSLCEECAPTFQDCVNYWAKARTGETPLNEDEEEAAKDAWKALTEHLEHGGSAGDKPLWVMT